jgi:hypothetical protein
MNDTSEQQIWIDFKITKNGVDFAPIIYCPYNPNLEPKTLSKELHIDPELKY